MKRPIGKLFCVFALCLAATSVSALSNETASAKLHDTDGNVVGTVALRQTKAGVWLVASFVKLPAGTHGFHIHETGKCEGDFKSAGGHYAPESHEHGVLVDKGPHAGDMPNIHVPADGQLTVEIFAPNVALPKNAANTLFDEDGSAIVVHDGADDYQSQPSGDAGARIACGVVTVNGP